MFQTRRFDTLSSADKILFIFTSIYSHLLPFTHIYLCVLPFTHMYFHLLTFTSMYSHLLTSTSIYSHLLTCTSIYSHVLPFTHIYFHVLTLTYIYFYLLTFTYFTSIYSCLLPFTHIHLPIPMMTNAAAPFNNPSVARPNTTLYIKNANGKLRTIATSPQTVSQRDRDVRIYMRIAMAPSENRASWMSPQKIVSTW